MRPGLGLLGCILIVAAGVGALAIGLAGLMMEPVRGQLVAAAGFAGYFAVCAATVFMIMRS
ncbi:MAG: hypothetical protein F9K29_02520 [Hyphomicrobiaceae bacterium]|nr:MAG: hypothetical protein F9K29_02520 [Hyphomicrobiaceae bacterium]